MNAKRSSASVKSNVSAKSNKSNMSTKSNSSSQSDSVSAVTRADLETLAGDMGRLIREEVQSVMTSGTDVTMLTLLKEELEASRKQNQQQMAMMQTQITMCQSMMSTLNPMMFQRNKTQPYDPGPEATKNAPDENAEKEEKEPYSPVRNPATSPHPESPPMISTQPDDPQPKLKSSLRVKIKDGTNEEPTEHHKPGSSGDTPPPKKSRGRPSSNATQMQRRQLNDVFAGTELQKLSTNSNDAVGERS
jgi:hypothetical protein